MENAIGNIERFVKFGDVFLFKGINLKYSAHNSPVSSVTEEEYKARSINTVHRAEWTVGFVAQW